MPLPNANDYSTRIYELLKETDLENLSYSQFQNVAEKLFIEPENEDELRRLVLVQLARMAVRGDWDGFLTGGGTSAVTSLIAGTNITLSPVSGLGDVTINAAGASGAPDDAQYVTLATDATLTNERVLTAGAGVSLTDAGAGSTATIANTGVIAALGGVGITTNTVGGSATITNTGVTSNVAGDGIVLSGATGAVTISAPLLGDLILPEYVTLATDTQLQNERVLTAGTGITLTDAGAGSTITIAATGGGGAGYQPVLPDRDGSFPPSNRELYLVSCMPPWGNTQSSSTGSTTASSNPYFRPFISPVGGTVTEIQVNVNSDTDTPDYYIGIYSDSGGLPDSKIAEAEISIAATGVLAATTFTGTPTLVAGTQYHFAWVRKDTSGAGNFTAELASSCFKYASVSQTYPNLTSVGDTGATIALSSGSPNALPATVSTGNLVPFSNNPIRFGLRWD